MEGVLNGVVRLDMTRMSDYIAPAQDCTVLVSGAAGKQEAKIKVNMNMNDEFEGEIEGNGAGKRRRKKGNENEEEEKVKIRLADCLACSGCVTTSEVLLAETQNASELLERIRERSPGERIVVSVSPQSAASMAAYYFGDNSSSSSAAGTDTAAGAAAGGGVPDTAAMLALLQRALDNVVDLVIGTAAARELALLAAADEFVQRQRRHYQSRSCESMVSDGDGDAPRGNGMVLAGKEHEMSTSAALPLLGSTCPGWVCYAEKSGGVESNSLVPLLSVVKSPQQVLGALLKRQPGRREREDNGHVMGGETDTNGDVSMEDIEMDDDSMQRHMRVRNPRIYHCTVMPCYDTKLEATRDENVISADDAEEERTSTSAVEREVDCVLTTGEFAQLLEDQGIDLRAIATKMAEPSMSSSDPGDVLPEQMLAAIRRADIRAQAGGASGGYAEFVFRRAARELHGIDVDGPVRWTRGRNDDMQELELTDGTTGRALLRVARVYGFRNIQTLVRKIKRRAGAGSSSAGSFSSDASKLYDFVEVMACPGGCLNGGGQMKKDNLTTKAMLNAAEASYYSPRLELSTGIGDDAWHIYDDIRGGRCGESMSEDATLHTSFRARSASSVSLAGVANAW